MPLFLLRRVLSAIVLLLAISLLAYVLLYPAAGDIARNVLGENATEEQVALKNAELGLDQPLLVQYVNWLTGAATGNLGVSFFSSQPVSTILAVRLPVTLSLVIIVTLLSGVLAFAIGMYAAIKRGWIDRGLQLLATLGDALPAFIVGLVLVTVFAVNLQWLPATGWVPFSVSPADSLRTLLLPVLALTIGGVAGVAQQVRSSTLAVLDQDHGVLIFARVHAAGP